MDIKFKRKDGVIRNKAFNAACTIFLTPCPFGRTNWSGAMKKVGDMGCMRYCKLEKKKKKAVKPARKAVKKAKS